MLSYRHGFHAGNYADVLKHWVLMRTLQYIGQKDKPAFYLETHAGRGMYSLTGATAAKTAEFRQGIGRLWQATGVPHGLQGYLDLIAQFNPGRELVCYPGSPWIARTIMRRQDRLMLCELHPQDFRELELTFQRSANVRCHREDGFVMSLASVPPSERRGVIFIDPSYEVKTDYQKVVDTLQKLHRKFASGTYLLWYPIVREDRTQAMLRQLCASGIRRVSVFELHQSADHSQPGMTGTGMLVINPPWTLMGEMQETLPFLCETLAPDGHWSARELTGE